MTENHISSPTIESYELVTDDLVKEVLLKDKGGDAELVSWEIKDFTNKGDNYSSIVICILVNYIKNENIYEESFVAKLNPLRPHSSFTEIFEDMYAREAIVLSTVIEGMNKQLALRDLPKIRTPKLIAKNLDKGREVFVTENLRKQGFKMLDKRNGLDLNHAILVLKELGRFHASSLLYEETLAPKTIPECFEYFKETWFDINHSSFQIFNSLISNQADGAMKVLSPIPKYKKCVKWLEANKSNMGRFYIEGIKPSNKFNLFTHGDCWTNNLLFKYNKENVPVDMRFVDLQCSRKSSPASDIVYFFYSSLDERTRKNSFQEMLYIYYQSFSRVLLFSRRKVPFTFKELVRDVENRRTFGLTSGLMHIMGILLSEEEDLTIDDFTDDKVEEMNEIASRNIEKVTEKKGPVKDRFLALFDEMLDFHLFDEISNGK